MAAADAQKNALEKIFRTVDSKVSPSKAEAKKEAEVAQEALKALSKALPEAAVTFVGSSARDTGLAGDRDIDIFAIFNRKLPEDLIVERTFKAARSCIKAKWVKHYAEHPYLQCVYKGFAVEVIPCFAVETDQPIKSAVDRSPLHMDYLQARLSPAQKRDVRVLKQLLRNNGLYGAEAKVEGFSGFVCELLVLNYRSLYGLLAEASKWRTPVYLDIEGYYSQDEGKLKSAFADAHIVIVDVTDMKRNAAAAISLDNLARFCNLCRAILSKPSLNLFFSAQKKVSKQSLLSAMDSRKTHYACIRCKLPDLVDDILYPQLRKTSDGISTFLSRQGFSIIDHAYFTDAKDAYLLFELEYDRLGPVKKVGGPPAFDAASIHKFLSTRPRKSIIRGPYIRDGRTWVEVRSGQPASDALKQYLSSPATSGCASHFTGPMKKAKFFVGSKSIVSNLPAEIISGMADFVERKEPWF